MNENEFVKELEKINIFLNKEKLDKLNDFYKIMIEWNNKINLTRIVEKKEVYLKHFYDSLTLYKAVNLNENITLCDIGSGAGFPGIVLKIVFPNLNIVLIDSLNKRVNYLNLIIKKLNLNKIEAIHIRAEDYKNKFDIVTSRAVANLSKLIDYSMHLVKEDGVMIAMKANIDSEINVEQEILKKNKCRIEEVIEFYLPIEESKRSLVIVKKNS